MRRPETADRRRLADLGQELLKRLRRGGVAAKVVVGFPCPVVVGGTGNHQPEVPAQSGAYFSQTGMYRDKAANAGGWPMRSPNPQAVDDCPLAARESDALAGRARM